MAVKPIYDALVRITSREAGNSAAGSGFVIHHDEEGTYVVTCRHVLDQICGDGERLVLVDGEPARSICEGTVSECDLALLCCGASWLRTKPGLLLAESDLLLDFLILGFWRSNDRSDPADRFCMHFSGSAGSRMLLLRNDPEHPVTYGHSGSPVLDFHSKRVIGVVTTTPDILGKKTDYRQTQIGVTPIERLGDLWKAMPDGFLTRRSDPMVANLDKTRAGVPLKNPYLGLSCYGEKDAEAFFGRELEVDELAERITNAQGGLQVVVGPSGSGKSSFVRAGILPRLFNQVPGNSARRFMDISLGGGAKTPFEEMASAFHHLVRSTGVTPRSPAELRRDLCDPLRIESFVQEILAGLPKEHGLVILVDQFEELFTLFDNQDEQRRLAHLLADLLRCPRVTIIITLRADFLDKFMQLPRLTDARRRHDFLYPLEPPGTKSLLAIIQSPARAAGLRFEDEYLPYEILNDAGSGPGVLPLLSYVLQQLAQPDRLFAGNVMSRQVYRNLGAIGGIIQQRAGEAVARVKEQLEAEQKEAEKGAFNPADHLPLLFSSLVRVNDDGVPARRPANREDQAVWTEPARRLAEELTNQRMLQTSDAGTKGAAVQIGIIELSHEMLLTHWPALREWIDACRGSLLLLRRVEVAARDWKNERSRHCDPMDKLKVDRNFLWPDARLREVNAALHHLGRELKSLDRHSRAFLCPECDRLTKELELPINHERRAEIGDQLARLGDPRRGTGLGPDRLPEIEWCPVPAGSVSVNGTRFNVEPFCISKYVLTLRQFDAFANDDASYYDETWWTRLPVKPSDHLPIAQYPRIENHPAQFVSWYQAVAYSRWLGQSLGFEVRLPTEWEWQHAATGGRQFHYPWGVEWKPEHANTKDGGVGHIVSVGLYPEGVSPVGAMDMSGNIYEWCQNHFDDIPNLSTDGTAPRVTRGGAYFAFQSEARDATKVTARLRDNPGGYNERNDRIRAGIRLVCDKSSLAARNR
jgi:hypothetical protein